MENDRIKKFFFDSLIAIRESYLRYSEISRSVSEAVSLESAFDNTV